MLTGNVLKINDFDDLISAIDNLKKSRTNTYMRSLIYPEISKNIKIPSPYPIGSIAFQMKQSITITTNILGNACIVYNPYYLGNASNVSTMYINNDDSLTGISSSDFYISAGINQSIPTGIYEKYRVVSSASTLKYIGRGDNVEGIVGSSIIFDDAITPFIVGSASAQLAKYGDFNLSQDAFINKEYLVLEGIRSTYFPIDSTFLEYKNIGFTQTGFGFVFYIKGAPPSSTIFKYDVITNYECLPTTEFLNFMPISQNKICNNDLLDETRGIEKYSISNIKSLDLPYYNQEEEDFLAVIDDVIDVVGDTIDLSSI